jgi:Cu(I)/Ag(I) efflux system membrane fusion protein
MRLLSLADLSSVWILAEIFERQASWVKQGQKAQMKLSYIKGKVWEGKVEYIYPSLDPKTRTLKVRLRFDNKDEQLKPNMYAKINIFAGDKKNVIAVPLEALIRTGSEERIVVAKKEGRFETREVISGIESDELIEITRGVEVGEQVVVSGQFLIDSESSLKGSITRMTPLDDSMTNMQISDTKDMKPMSDTNDMKKEVTP